MTQPIQPQQWAGPAAIIPCTSIDLGHALAADGAPLFQINMRNPLITCQASLTEPELVSLITAFQEGLHRMSAAAAATDARPAPAPEEPRRRNIREVIRPDAQ